MKKYFRFIPITLLLAVLLTCSALLSFADEEGETVETEKQAVFIAGEVYYDRDQELFRYPIPNRDEGIFANVMDGMITTEKVIIRIPDDHNITVYRNGKEFTVENNSISKAGSYLVNCTSDGTTVQIFSFRIVGEITGNLENYRMPSNFAVDSVDLDGKRIEGQRNSVDFSEEGLYVVEYSCVPTGVRYQLKILVDHTAPVLRLDGVKNGSANGPVDVSDLEKGAKLVVKRNGKVVSDYPRLTKSGNYELTVTDAAGNSNQYQFTIQVYFNTNSIVLFVLLILGILALIIYIYKARSGLKVR